MAPDRPSLLRALRRRLGGLHAIGIAVVAMVSLTAFLAAWTVWDSYRDTRAGAEKTLQNLARMLEQDIARNVELFDTAIQNAQINLGLPGLATADPAMRQAALFGGISNANYMTGVLVLNAQGGVEFESAHTIPRTANYADRDYFLVHKGRADAGLFVSAPFQGRLTGVDLIAFSRRRTDDKDQFAGVVYGGMRLSYFQDLFAGLNLGEHGSVTLLRDDGKILARWPYVPGQIGQDLPKRALAQEGIVEAQAAVDGVWRLYALRRVGHLPLRIHVGFAVNEVLAPWRHKAIATGLGLLMFGCLSLLLVRALRREFRRRARAEGDLRDTAAGFQLLAEHASDMITRVGADGSRLYISPAAQRIFGVPPEQLLGMRLLEWIHPEDRPRFLARVQRWLAGVTEPTPITFRVRNKMRGEVWVESTGVALLDPVTGAPDGYVAVTRDVTERLSADQALAESEARYRLIASNTSDAIVCLSLDAWRTYASPAFQTMFGYEPEEVIGCPATKHIHADDWAAFEGAFRPLLAGEADSCQATYRIQHKAGHFVWVEASARLVRDPQTGAPVSAVNIMRDVSDRRAHEQELRRSNEELERLARQLLRAKDEAERGNRAKSRFLATMTHELRTPLNGILGYAHLFRLAGGLDALQTQRVEQMLAAGQHLLDLINRVLTFSEIEEDRMALHPAHVDLRELTQACLDLVRPAAEAKSLRLQTDIAPAAPTHVFADPTRLRQILINLLGNAVKFTAEGFVQISIAPGIAAGTVRLAVTDTGPGIPAAKRELLFQTFERLAADTEAIEGAGLGLALSAGLARLMGGRLAHEHRPQGGSVFWLEIPVRPEPE